VTNEQFSKLQRGFDKNSNYLDINYDVIPGKYPTILTGGGCITSALRIWLQSKKTDYHRRPGHGGFFGNLLNDRYPLSTDHEEDVKKDLVAEIEKKFPDVTVIAIDVNADVPRRAWVVRLVVQDLRTKIIADDMATSNVSVAIPI
jgi:hypothetical protein